MHAPLIAIFLTIAAALSVAVLELLLKGVSRWRMLIGPSRNNNPLARLYGWEDLVFFQEWIVGAMASWVFFVVADLYRPEDINRPAIIGLIMVLIVGILPVPAAVGAILYDQQRKVRPGWPLIAANLIGLAFLVAAVAVGVKVYG